LAVVLQMESEGWAVVLQMESEGWAVVLQMESEDWAQYYNPTYNEVLMKKSNHFKINVQTVCHYMSFLYHSYVDIKLMLTL